MANNKRAHRCLQKEGVNTWMTQKLCDHSDEQQEIEAGLTMNPTQYNDAIDEAIYGSDEFRMFAYKIKRCPRMRSHDWTECPYAHRGEKAQRRDPRKLSYCAVACPAFRNGRCYRGETCDFAHGVFEYWLHPARYRTRACNAGRFCQRKVCFFAHTPQQLRSETKYKCQVTYRGRMYGGDEVIRRPVQVGSSQGRMLMSRAPGPVKMPMKEEVPGDFLRSLSGLKIKEKGSSDGSDLDLSHLEWISKLLD
uniref:PEI1-like n=1 Tax=Carica papaya TaxID=3649 RepID=T1SFR9_CARPA|nr:PEI1-like [Carica papaya]